MCAAAPRRCAPLALTVSLAARPPGQCRGRWNWRDCASAQAVVAGGGLIGGRGTGWPASMNDLRRAAAAAASPFMCVARDLGYSLRFASVFTSPDIATAERCAAALVLSLNPYPFSFGQTLISTHFVSPTSVILRGLRPGQGAMARAGEPQLTPPPAALDCGSTTVKSCT